MTWSLTRTGVPCEGAYPKPHDYKQSTKNEGPFENMGFDGKTV